MASPRIIGKAQAEAAPNGGSIRPPTGMQPEADDNEQGQESDEEQIARMFGSLPAGSSVSIYRSAPVWAEGHLQSVTIEPGAAMDFRRIDEIAAYWGGGTYKFRPVINGKWGRGARTLRIDGPTLFMGQPHHADPRRRIIGDGQGYETHHYPPQQPQPMGFAVPPGQPRADGLQTLLGQMLERLDTRMGAIETAMRTPPPPVANPVDPTNQLLNSLKLAKAAAEFFNRRGEDDDDEGEEESQPGGIEGLIEKLLQKKLDEDDKPAKKPKPATTGPRIIRQGAPDEPRAEAAPDSVPNPPAGTEEMLAMFQAMPAAKQAKIFKGLGDRLTPDVVAELEKLVRPSGGAAADDSEGEDDSAD